MRDSILEQDSAALGSLAILRREALWTPAFVRLLCAASAFGFAFSSFHLLPKYLAVELGAGPGTIGAVAGVFGAAAVVTTLGLGSCIDRVSRRTLLTVAALLMAATAAAFICVDSVGVMLYLLRTLQGVAFTMQMAAMSTLIVEMAPAPRLGEAMGLSGSAMLIMNAVAPAIDEPLADAVGWPAVFGLAVIAALVSALLLGQGSAAERQRVNNNAAARAGLGQVLRSRQSSAYVGVVLLSAIAFAAMFTFLQPLALESGYHDVGGFFIAYALAAVVVRVFFGWAADRLGRRAAATAALVLYVVVVAYVALFGATSLYGIGAVFGVAHGVFYPSLSALALEHTRVDQRGRLMTLFAGAFNLGAWGGAAALGLIAEGAGYGAVFSVGALSAAGALLLLCRSREVPLA